MAKNHIKRITIPETWTVSEKKRIVWAARPNPGAHSLHYGMPLVLVLREMLNYANTAREARQILNSKTVLVDQIRRKDLKFCIGFMDSLSIPEIKENYRISLSKYGKLCLIKIDDKEAKQKICQISGKGMYKGKVQLQLSDGRTMIISKNDCKTNDSIVMSVPEQKIILHIKFEKGALVMLVDGKKIGIIGTIEEIKGNSVRIKSESGEFETLKKYCFAVGKGKPELKIN